MKITITISIERAPAPSTPAPSTQAVHAPPAAPTSKLPPVVPDFRQGGYA